MLTALVEAVGERRNVLFEDNQRVLKTLYNHASQN